MTTEVHHSSKDSARDNWLRGHRVSQDHGHAGPTHLPSEDQDWLNYAPRRVKAAEQPIDYLSAPTIEGIEDTDYSAYAYEKESLEDFNALVYSETDDELTALDDNESSEYEDAYDELAAFLDRHSITGEERTKAVEAFRTDAAIRYAFYEQAHDLSTDVFPTSYDQVDSANRMSARALTDYRIEGAFEDDNGDYHVPHMSVRT